MQPSRETVHMICRETDGKIKPQTTVEADVYRVNLLIDKDAFSAVVEYEGGFYSGEITRILHPGDILTFTQLSPIVVNNLKTALETELAAISRWEAWVNL